MMQVASKIEKLTVNEEDVLTFFLAKLKRDGMSQYTLESYGYTVKSYLRDYGDVTSKNLAAWRSDLIDMFKPKTVNIRMAGMNAYLKYLKKHAFVLKNVKVQQKPFLENVISMADYQFLIKCLKEDGSMNKYFMVRFLAATGARVSEFVNLKVEHVQIGHFDIYGKGGKMRRLYIPKKLQTEALVWLAKENRNSGYLFPGMALESNGGHITSRGVSSALRDMAQKYGIPKDVMHPHSFRHLYGKTFMERVKDITLLADLMGHESIDTTRIYTRRTATEQKEIVDRTVTW